MSKRGVNIYKRKDGRWEGRYIKCYTNGKLKYGYVYAKTYREVKEKLLENINSKQEVKNSIATSKLVFEIAAEKWLDSITSQLKESSIVKYRNILNSYLYPSFGKMEINSITYSDITDFSTKLINCGGIKKTGLSPKTVSAVLSVLKSIFEYTAKDESIIIPDFSDIYIKQCPKPMRILSVSEQSKLNQYLRNDLSLSNIGILICMFTGIRIGEVCALKWKNVLFNERCISIESTAQRLQKFDIEGSRTEVVISEPKSPCSIRKVPIPDNLYYILRELKQGDEDFLLTGNNKDVLEPRTLQNRFKAVIKKCGIDDANFHSLRHTFATRCVEVGVDVKSLSEILGHASVNITLNRYVHPSMELKLKNINMLSDSLAVK